MRNAVCARVRVGGGRPRPLRRTGSTRGLRELREDTDCDREAGGRLTLSVRVTRLAGGDAERGCGAERLGRAIMKRSIGEVELEERKERERRPERATR